MKTKYVLTIFFGSLLAGSALVWLFSGGGKAPIELIPPKQFTSQKAIGASAYDKINNQIRAQKLLVIGIPPQPEVYQDVILGFLERLAAADPSVIVLKEPKWPSLPKELKVESYDFVFNEDDLTVEAESVRKALDAGHTVVIYTVNVFSSHLIAGNPTKRFEATLKRKMLALTVGHFTLRHNGEHRNDPACVGSMRDLEGLYELGCAQIANSRHHYKELLPLDQISAMLIEQSKGDYLLQVYLPEKKN